ncbi:MAG: hypothetical protein IME93_03225 [Proteobacteria bacterium]|nr:hypothetical protein [Pseudomonadota bacterium]
MAIKVKEGASISNCRKEILCALITIISPLFKSHDLDTVVTSGAEMYKHSVKRSAHYRGDAVDLRSKHIPNEGLKAKIFDELAATLGDDFVVLWEGVGKPWEHYHIHWSPVYRD